MGRRDQRAFHSVPTRCPSCKPIARVDLKGWQPEAVYVGFLKTDAYEGYKRAPQSCPTCGSNLIEVGRAG